MKNAQVLDEIIDPYNLGNSAQLTSVPLEGSVAGLEVFVLLRNYNGIVSEFPLEKTFVFYPTYPLIFKGIIKINQFSFEREGLIVAYDYGIFGSGIYSTLCRRRFYLPRAEF